MFIVAQIFCMSIYFPFLFQDTTQNRIIASATLLVVLVIFYFILWFIGKEITNILILEFVINFALSAITILLQFPAVPEFVFYIIYAATAIAGIWFEFNETFIDGR